MDRIADFGSVDGGSIPPRPIKVYNFKRFFQIMKREWEIVKDSQKEIILLGQTSALLGWDEQTYIPKEGIYSRAEQCAFISKLIHEKMMNNSFFESVRKLKNSNLKGEEKRLIDRTYKCISNARKLPKEFVEELSKTTSLAHHSWKEARKKNSFKLFQKDLTKIFDLKRKQAKLIGLEGHPYNSLLDDYEEGMTAEKLKPIFNKLKFELVDLIKKIENTDEYYKKRKVLNEFSKEDQMHLVKDVIQRIGLGENNSRIDFSEHPFTTKIGQGDVRVTTALRKNPFFAFESSIHEAGHALYELGLPVKHQYDFLGDSPSLGIHESQSRFWENMISKGKPFWRYYYPKFKDKFNLNLDFNEWYKEVNLVHPGFIRVESDELHYCLHIILRFELELGLLDGSIKVGDLPGLWNSKMKELFGVVPRNYVEGVLQDVHWSGGSVGYFPTYALGTIYAAQIYTALRKTHSSIEKEIERGDYSKIRNWLIEKVHRHGSLYMSEELIKKVCGKGLDVEEYMRYLTGKYRDIYRF